MLCVWVLIVATPSRPTCWGCTLGIVSDRRPESDRSGSKLGTRPRTNRGSPVSEQRSDVGMGRAEEGDNPEGCGWPSGVAPFLAGPFYLLHLQHFTGSFGDSGRPSSPGITSLDDEPGPEVSDFLRSGVIHRGRSWQPGASARVGGVADGTGHRWRFTDVTTR